VIMGWPAPLSAILVGLLTFSRGERSGTDGYRDTWH
jgi:hypothetical protein